MKNNLSKGLPFLDFGDDDCMLPKLVQCPPSQHKTKQYEHGFISVQYEWQMEKVTDKLNKGWEVLRVDQLEDCVVYIIRKESK